MSKLIFQEVSDELDESWRHGFLIGGMAAYDKLAIADAFKLAGDVLVKEALADGEAWMLCHPVLYNYRHSLELYLKLILQADQRTHDLATLLQSLDDYCQKRYNQSLPLWFREPILEFDEFDSRSTSFRYDSQLSSRHIGIVDERWIDLHNVQGVMKKLQEAFHWLINDVSDSEALAEKLIRK